VVPPRPPTGELRVQLERRLAKLDDEIERAPWWRRRPLRREREGVARQLATGEIPGAIY
jgi:hypothetical protein